MKTETLAIGSVYLDRYSKGVKKVGNLKNPTNKAYSAIANIQNNLRLLGENKDNTEKIIQYLFEIKEYMYIIADAREEIKLVEATDIEKSNMEKYYAEMRGMAISISCLLHGIKTNGYRNDWADIAHFFAHRTGSGNVFNTKFC